MNLTTNSKCKNPDNYRVHHVGLHLHKIIKDVTSQNSSYLWAEGVTWWGSQGSSSNFLSLNINAGYWCVNFVNIH